MILVVILELEKMRWLSSSWLVYVWGIRSLTEYVSIYLHIYVCLNMHNSLALLLRKSKSRDTLKIKGIPTPQFLISNVIC